MDTLNMELRRIFKQGGTWEVSGASIRRHRILELVLSDRLGERKGQEEQPPTLKGKSHTRDRRGQGPPSRRKARGETTRKARFYPMKRHRKACFCRTSGGHLLDKVIGTG